MKDIFPLNDTEYHVETREREAFKVTMAKTERLKRSAVPYMQRLPCTRHTHTQYPYTYTVQGIYEVF